MSKNTNVKAAAQGGPDSAGGGGPPGTWSLINSGFSTINSNQTVNLATFPLPTNAPITKEVYVLYVSPATKSPIADVSISQGPTLTAPPTSCIYYGMIIDGTSDITARVRAGASLSGATDFFWAVYKVIVP